MYWYGSEHGGNGLCPLLGVKGALIRRSGGCTVQQVYALVCIGLFQSVVEMAYVPSWVFRVTLYEEAANVWSRSRRHVWFRMYGLEGGVIGRMLAT